MVKWSDIAMLTIKIKHSLIHTTFVDFLLIDRPNKDNILEFNKILVKNNVNYIISILDELEAEGEIGVCEMFKQLRFADGSPPPTSIIDEFNKFISACKSLHDRPAIAIYCRSSYGRAPCLIALEMINTNILSDRMDIITYIRDNRKGCFNTKQIGWILTYKLPQDKHSKKCCIIL